VAPLSCGRALAKATIVVMKLPVRFDAPFWVALLAGVILVGSVACIGIAAAAQNAAKSETDIVSLGDT
jgi:hypothetical protein